ncbi:DUF5107 domain-containing protein [Jiangella asiatica]|uniref:DUF5107 domain-containing protein n=1 Tax=Jiangella asiatica TaxID=2530372 RepID=A0A4R5D421_9ACTN|nr:DUF5107 domain-containing protein [Jiangella asiatica]TDE08016.1 DUF5107 domain-containing protein [Jiangella asiatica]
MTRRHLVAERGASVLRVTTMRLPCAPVPPDDPVPLVDRTLEAPFELTDDLPDRIREGASFGWPRSMHPYLMQNWYGRDRVDTDLTCVVLENEHLRATFLPQLGGRLWSLTDVGTGRELLYRNPVVQPANLALRNAWFAGGVEWNIGTRGHSPHTVSPMHAASVAGADGVPSLRMWEFERLRRVVYQVDARLAPGSRALVVHVRIQNPNDEAVPMYWWSNAAVPERPDVRVIVPATHAYATSYDGTVREVPVPGHSPADRTRPSQSAHAADHFFVLDRPRPWIAAVDASGHGLAQVSTRRLPGRKMFCWGTEAGGRRWQRWLSPEGGNYLEIQAGLAATQFEHLAMPAGATWSWVEAYGDVAADPAVVHGDDWHAAIEHVDSRMDRVASAEALAEMLEQAEADADVAPSTTICTGSGWGALERVVRARTGRAWIDETGVPFSIGTIGPEQQLWHDLVQDPASARRALLDADPQVPPRSYMVGEVWESLLTRADPSWARDYHLGVLAHATGDLALAGAYYRSSLAHRPSAWALRGLGRIAGEQGDRTVAADLLGKAAAMTPAEPTLVVEAMAAALDAEDAAGALRLLDAVPAPVREQGRIALLEARAALACGRRDRAARILDRGIVIPDLREGDTSLSDLWLQVHPGEPVPAGYDFRMR